MQNKLKASFLTLTCLATLAACSGSNGGGASSGSNEQLQPDEIAEVSHPLFIDELGVVPTTGSYLLNLNNLSPKNYTLDSIKITDANGNDQSILLSVSGQMCERLVANGSCSIEFSPNTATSNTLLLTVGLRDSKNELHQVHQIVRISDKLGSDSGISFATEVGDVVTEKGDYRITIPVVLNEDFDKVEAFNGSLLCGSGGAESFKKGSSCTYQISGKALADNTVVSANIRGYRAGKLVTEQTDNLNVRIADIPDLVLSQGVSLKANGESEASITVYNDGNKDATGVVYSHTLPGGVVTAGSCTTITKNSMCAIKVKATSETHGSGRVTASYDTPSRKVGTNISYTGITNVGVVVTAKGTLENILLDESATTVVTIKNIGKNELTDFKATLLKAGNGMKVDAVGATPCKTTLLRNEECELTVKYSPTQAQASTEAEVLVTGQYKGEQGQLNSYSTRYSIAYSAIDSKNVLVLTAPKNMLIIADGTKTDSQKVTVRRSNAGALPLSLNKIAFNKTVGQLNFLTGTNLCNTNSSLSKESPSCEIGFSYGPITSSKTIKESEISLDIEYKVGTKPDRVLSNKFNVQADQANANVRLSNSKDNSNTISGLIGEGTPTSPFSFIALSDENPLTLTYTFKNEGNIPATNVDIGAGSESMVFPYGVEVKKNTCTRSAGGSVSLDTGATCEVVLNVPDVNIFNDVGHVNSTLPIQNGGVQLPLSINYTDINGRHTDTEASKFVRFSRNWAGVSYTTKSITKTGDAWHVVLKATVNPVKASYYPIAINVIQTVNNHLDRARNVKGCQITTTDNKTCEELSFDLPLDSYPASGDVLVETELSSATLAKNKLRANHRVTYGDANISARVTKMWAQPRFKEVISHGAGESLPFEVEFINAESGQEAIVELKNTQGQSLTLDPAKIVDGCKTLLSRGNCKVSGLVGIPLLNKMQPESYAIDLSVELGKGVLPNRVIANAIHIKESGQYVQTFNKNSRSYDGSPMNGEVDYSSLNSPGRRGIIANLDNVLFEGPTTLQTSGINPDSYNISKVNALNMTTGLSASVAIYSSIVGSESQNSAMFASYQVVECGQYCNQETLRLRTDLVGSTWAYENLPNGKYNVLNTTDIQNLNQNLPKGRYVTTFFFIRDGDPIKIDLDWTKK